MGSHCRAMGSICRLELRAREVDSSCGAEVGGGRRQNWWRKVKLGRELAARGLRGMSSVGAGACGDRSGSPLEKEKEIGEGRVVARG